MGHCLFFNYLVEVLKLRRSSSFLNSLLFLVTRRQDGIQKEFRASGRCLTSDQREE